MLYVPRSQLGPSGRRDQIEYEVRRLLDLRCRGDISAVYESLAKDFVYKTQGNWPMWPFHRGPLNRDQYAEALRRLNAEIEAVAYVTHEFVVDGDTAAFHTTLTSRMRGSGPPFDLDTWMVWRFRDELVVEAASYVDMAGASALVHGDPIEVRSAFRPKARSQKARAGIGELKLGVEEREEKHALAAGALKPDRDLALALERREVEEAIGGIFNWRQRCDLDSVYERISPDFRFGTRGTWSIRPLGGGPLDRLRFAEALGRVNVAVETLGRRYAEFLIDGGSAAVHWTAQVRNRGSGPTYDLDSWAYFRIRDGQMTECAYYPDSSRAPGLGPPFRLIRSLSLHDAD